ncbi:hypothetical protein WMF30_16310 [Sorangium sp. So ce134]
MSTGEPRKEGKKEPMTDDLKQTIEQVKEFAETWNKLYAEEQFEQMKELATEDVGIANASESKSKTGLIYGRQAYYDGIVGAYRGASGKEKNLLVMQYEGWEYVSLGDPLSFYTIGKYTLQPDIVGVNCWLLRRTSPTEPWRIFRVINT